MGNIDYEKQVAKHIIGFYCRKKHSSKTLCPNCKRLMEYALQRLTKCPFGDDKMACKVCTAHCYNAEMREKIREVMRYSGPRMIIYHPVYFIKHFLKK